MFSRSWQERVQDIIGSILAILARTESKNLDDVLSDSTVGKATMYDFIIIGEAARNVPPNIQAKAPDIPWRLMTGMRNVAAHECFKLT
jgi:uncharacterized protein with HEPN domain